MSQPVSELPPIASGGSILKRCVIGVLVVVVLAIVLAELGVLQFDSTDAHWTTEQKSQWNATNVAANRRGTFLNHFRMMPEVKVAGPSGSGKAVADQAAKAIRSATQDSKGADGAKLTITITQATTTGAAWLPMYRHGSCKFAATYQIDAAAGASSMQVRGEVQGNVEQTMKGFSSLGYFQEKMGQTIANQILKDILKGTGMSGS